MTVGDARAVRMIHAPDSPLKAILASIERIARSRAPVLVTGESGTGKEGIARLVHALAPWSAGPLVPVNCGAIPGTLLESELFGHVRGAFTGADRNRVGRFEAAHDGTLFLDEIGETPLELQVKLLRVLQDGTYYPVGGSTAKQSNARIVAATNVDVVKAVREGRFREDLYFRLDVVRIDLPPLRGRTMDIAPLARHFLEKHRAANLSTVSDVSAEGLAELAGHTWPGNVRELENVIQGILVLKETGLIEAEDVRRKLGVRRADGPSPEQVGAAVGEDLLRVRLPEGGITLRETLDRLESDYIRAALTRTGGNRAHAANLLGLNRTTLVEKLKRLRHLGLEQDEGGSEPGAGEL
jgi:two-component system response regulator AtoC